MESNIEEMKKEYINPEMLVIKMQTMTVLAASGDEDMVVTSETTTTLDASQWFDNGDSSEDW